MKRTILIIFCLVLFAAMSMVGCGVTDKTSIDLTPGTYSNLSDEKTLDEVADVLKNAGIDSTCTEEFKDAVNLYNDTINRTSLVKEGFVEWQKMPQYDEGTISELWQKKYPMFPGFNCRLTSYGLLKDFISIKNTTIANPKDVFMDDMSLDNWPLTPFTEEERACFDSLFSTVSTEASKDINVHYESFMKSWADKGISFDSDSPVSLICVVLHTTLDGNELFVGHAGVAVSMEKEILFIEKLSFESPYQAIVFSSKKELYDYLMETYNTSWEENAAPPFIVENDQLLEY